MSDFEAVEIPFLTLGNRQILTGLQLVELPWLQDFMERFPKCFKADPCRDILVYYPEGDA